MQYRVNKIKWLYQNGRRQVPFTKNSQARDRRNTVAYAGYIRQVVDDRKVCKIGNDMYVLSFINPRLRAWCSRSRTALIRHPKSRNNSCNRGLIE